MLQTSAPLPVVEPLSDNSPVETTIPVISTTLVPVTATALPVASVEVSVSESVVVSESIVLEVSEESESELVLGVELEERVVSESDVSLVEESTASKSSSLQNFNPGGTSGMHTPSSSISEPLRVIPKGAQ